MPVMQNDRYSSNAEHKKQRGCIFIVPKNFSHHETISLCADLQQCTMQSKPSAFPYHTILCNNFWFCRQL